MPVNNIKYMTTENFQNRLHGKCSSPAFQQNNVSIPSSNSLSSKNSFYNSSMSIDLRMLESCLCTHEIEHDQLILRGGGHE